MEKLIIRLIGFTTLILTGTTLAQEDVWSNLARTTFDSAAMTLRVPCVSVGDSNGNPLAEYAPAYAINLRLSGSSLELVDPIRAFDSVPDSCLDSIRLSADGNIATYETVSAELDTDRAESIDRFYTLRLEANFQSATPTTFTLVSESSRDYRRAYWAGDLVDVFMNNRDAVFDDEALEASRQAILADLHPSEVGVYTVVCEYEDLDNLLELFEVVGNNNRYRFRASVSSADNGKHIYIGCTVRNEDLNLQDLHLPVYTLITVSLPA